MRVATRAATREDLPVLDALLTRCAAALRSERGGRLYVGRELVRPPFDVQLDAFLASPDALVLAGTIDDEIFAVGIVRIETLADGDLLGRLEVLYVAPDAREVGLGEALVTEAMSWAAARGATGLDAYALPGNREAELSRVIGFHRSTDRHVSRAERDGGLSSPPVDAVLAVGAVVVEDGRLLLIRRGRPPGQGRWSLPGGRLEPLESLEDAVRREVSEETGIDVEPAGLLGSAERIGPGWHYVILDFRADVVPNGKPLVAGDDADAARWVPLGEVLGLALVDGLAEWLVDHGVLPR